MQLNSLDRICNSHQGISAAERNNAAEAFKALCGLAAGFTGNGVKQATFKEGLVVLPDPGTKMADGSTGSNLDVWSDWRMILLRSPSEFHEAIALEGRNAPHTDLELKRKPRFYARLVREMSVCGLVSFGPLAETFVRVFVVPKQHTSCQSTLSMARCAACAVVLGWTSSQRITWPSECQSISFVEGMQEGVDVPEHLRRLPELCRCNCRFSRWASLGSLLLTKNGGELREVGWFLCGCPSEWIVTVFRDVFVFT